MARNFVNLLADGYDFIGMQTHAADDDVIRREVNYYRVDELKPVLKAHGVKNISKMKKADIVEAIVELVHARQSEQAASEPETEAETTLETLELAAEPVTEPATEATLETVELAAEPEIMDELSNCKNFSDVVSVVKAHKLTADEFYKLAEPTMSGLEKAGLLHMIGQYCEAHDFDLDGANIKESYEARFNELFDELVPSKDKANNLAGELIRAVSRISHRYYNDGDRLGVGWGRETCNPAGRFLLKYGSPTVRRCVKKLWSALSDTDYEKYLLFAVQAIVDYVDGCSKLSELECEILESCRDPEQDVDDDEYEYDYNYEKFTAEFEEARAKLMSKIKAKAAQPSQPEHTADTACQAADRVQAELQNGGLTLSEQEAVLDGCNVGILRMLYARYIKKPITPDMDKFTMIRDIMFAIELDTPDLIDFDVKRRMLKAGSKAERIDILEHCTRYALLEFAQWQHESLNAAPVISPEFEDRRSILAKCIARLKDDEPEQGQNGKEAA
ncbi:MAG: hypothetical protein IJ667_12500 [Synergistaceae bacterium]|nr:hypothetical protein [Synergistaceae bacterium]